MTIATAVASPVLLSTRGRQNYARRYWLFILPAGIVVAAVIVFPWLFTVFMSLQDFHVGQAMRFAGLDNYRHMAADDRFIWAILRTFYFTAMAVVFPTIFGVAAAICFNKHFPFRGAARTIFILPMMATPVAIALVWTMMFHPQLGVLNYLLTSVGLPPSTWVYDSTTVLPTLVMVETWQWTPLIMLIVLGGLASLPQDPYEAAALDGASGLQCFRHITLPLVWPFIMVALVLRAVDALKAFDTIFVITGGGPGTSSETLNLYLYQEAFSYYDIGYSSAIVVVFFVLILLVTLLLMSTRKQTNTR